MSTNASRRGLLALLKRRLSLIASRGVSSSLDVGWFINTSVEAALCASGLCDEVRYGLPQVRKGLPSTTLGVLTVVCSSGSRLLEVVWSGVWGGAWGLTTLC